MIKRLSQIRLCKYSILFLLFYSASTAQTSAISTPPDFKKFSFKSESEKIVEGRSTQKNRAYNCSGTIVENETIGNLAIVSMLYQNGCYTDGQFNNKSYPVKKGFLTDSGNTTKIEAYEVSPPRLKATKFLASQHSLYYRFSTVEDYSVYSFDGNKLKKVSRILSSSIKLNQFTPTNIEVSALGSPLVYLFIPDSKLVSSFTELPNGVEAARIAKFDHYSVVKYRFPVSGKLFDTMEGFKAGPANHYNVYGPAKNYFFLKKSKRGESGSVWQDQKSGAVYLSWFANDFRSIKTINIWKKPGYKLAAATNDEKGFVYCLMVKTGTRSSSRGRKTYLFKVRENGKKLKKSEINTRKKGLNLYSFGNSNVASISFSNGNLGLIIGRTMHKSKDGLNHQGAIAVVFDAQTLKVKNNLGQTSGHSFENKLVVNSEGDFLGVDLADNYPRGVNLHKFNEHGKNSRVVYTFKTEHGKKSRSPAGRKYKLYKKISKGRKKFYKWSNDNRTYSELGGVIQSKQGYTVIFAGENNAGKSLDNSRTGDYVIDSRNIGLVLVRPDFEKAKGRGNVVTDDLILSKSEAEEGGFYTFGGTWSKQRNTGVQWLTHYNNKNEHASRVKITQTSDSGIWVLWEKWTKTNYVQTYAMKISSKGDVLKKAFAIGSHVRLGRTDDIWSIANNVFILSGDAASGKLELTVLKDDSKIKK